MFSKLFGLAPRGVESATDVHIVAATMPPQYRDGWRGGVRTYDALTGLIGSARSNVRVFSPYVDPTFTSLIHGVSPRIPIRVVTTTRDGRAGRPNPILERCSLDRELEVRYVVEYRHTAQMFQMHAKLLCVDDTAAYVGSANLTDTSIHYNLELGVVTRDPAELRSLGELFEFVWGSMAVPARRLWGGRTP